MRRGLMGWNAEELPVAALEARLARLRAAMAARRPRRLRRLHQQRAAERGDLAHRLHAVLVGRAAAGRRRPARRCSPPRCRSACRNWIRTTDPVSEIVNTPKPGTLIGERLASDRSVRRVGVLEFDTLPAGLADDMAAAAPAVEWIDGSALFAGLRRARRRRRAQAAGARRCDRASPRCDRGGNRHGQRRRHARRPGREARAARRRGGGLYRGRARSRRRPPARSATSQPTPLGGPLRGARVDRLQGLLGPPHPHLRQGRCRQPRLRACDKHGFDRLARASAGERRSPRSSRRSSRRFPAQRSRAGWPKAASAAIRSKSSPVRARAARTPFPPAPSWCSRSSSKSTGCRGSAPRPFLSAKQPDFARISAGNIDGSPLRP